MALPLQKLTDALDPAEGDGGVQPLAALAYGQILDAVVAGKLPGGSIVQERLLARLLNLSRTPIREAIRRLEGEGLLTRVSPRVLMVSRVTVAEVLEILAVRRLLEVEAVGSAIGKITRAEIDGLAARVHAILKNEAVTAEEYHQLDDDIHEGIAKASGNLTLCAIVSDLRRKTAMFDMRRIPERFRPSCEEHLRILDALYRGEAEAARHEIATHIDNVRQSILQRLSDGVEVGGSRS
jgi:DNA-binding GntR family transcriptional regulator